MTIPAIRGEGPEVVSPHEPLESLEVSFDIQFSPVPGQPVFQGRENGTDKDTISVDLSHRAEAGMKIRGDRLAGEDPNRRGKVGVESLDPGPAVHSPLGRDIKVGHLPLRRNTRVGPPRPLNGRDSGADSPDGIEEAVLDGVPPGLALPPIVVPTVIPAGQSKSLEFLAHRTAAQSRLLD
jgi:hypothetical protein